MTEHTILITGGAGFIGSHLAEAMLAEGRKVAILDNFSNGKTENIRQLLKNPSLTVVKEDLKKPKKLLPIVGASDIICHLAANPEVRIG